MTDLDKLEALAKAASEGPWTLTAGQTSYPECDDADSWSAVLTPRGNEVITLYERYGKRGDDRSDYDDDAAYIAAANPATILDLIASARRDAEEIERLVGYAVHDDTCTTNRFPGQDVCSCGLSSLLQQIRHKQEAADAR